MALSESCSEERDAWGQESERESEREVSHKALKQLRPGFFHVNIIVDDNVSYGPLTFRSSTAAIARPYLSGSSRCRQLARQRETKNSIIMVKLMNKL
jgi:hypothetical protein